MYQSFYDIHYTKKVKENVQILNTNNNNETFNHFIKYLNKTLQKKPYISDNFLRNFLLFRKIITKLV